MAGELVSFLVTAYNAERYLDKTMDSLLEQTYPNIEIVVVEDGSNDKTAELLVAKAENHITIKAYFPGRLGRSKALNFGLSKCRGTYIAVNDADDFSKPDRVQKQVDFLRAHPEIGLLGGRKEITEGGKTWVDEVIVSDEDIRRAFVNGQPIQHSTVMFRKEEVDKVGGYNEKIKFLLP